MKHNLDFRYYWFILLLSECIRGAFLISYIPYVPTVHPNVSIAIIGIAVSIHFVCDVLTNIVSGYLMKRIGVKIIMRCSFIFTSIGLFLLFFQRSSASLLVSSALLGIGLCSIWIVILSSIEEKDRANKISYVYVAWLVGLGTGAFMLNGFISHLTQPLLLIVLPVCLSWFLFERTRKDTLFTLHRTPNKTDLIQTIRVVRSSKVLYPGILLQGIGAGILLPVIPTLLYRHYSVQPNEYSLVIGTGAIVIIAGLVPFGKMADRIGKDIPIVVGFSCLAVGILSLLFSDRFSEVLVCAIVIGASYSLLMPAWNSFIAMYIPIETKESGWGLISSIQGVGGMIGPVLGGVVAEESLIIALIISSTCMLLSSIFYGIYFYNRKVMNA